MAKPRRANGHKHHKQETRHVVRIVAKVLATGEPTVFRWESWCRYNIRGNLCLQGVRWGRADERAAEIVRRALELLNVQRPPWAWGQSEYVWDSAGTRIGYSHCLQCGTKLPEGRLKFCASSCGDKYRQAFRIAVSDDARVRALAYLQARRDRAEPRVNVSATRPSVNAKIGGNGANGAGHSSPITPTRANGSAIINAGCEITRPSCDASSPRPEPSSDANGAGNALREPGIQAGNTAHSDANGTHALAHASPLRPAPS